MRNNEKHQIRSETSLCFLKDSTRLRVIQNRREPPTKPRTRLRTKGRATGANARQLRPSRMTRATPSRKMQSADPGFHPLQDLMAREKLILRPIHNTLRLHRRPDCDEECELVLYFDADSSVLLRLRATIGKSVCVFFCS